jgi:tetratricopeptide (TPR) repeat protein
VPARAEEPSVELKTLARKAFERGMGYYQKDEFDKAIEQFDVGFRLIPNPLFLYNMAQAHRLSNRPEKSLELYRRYLRESPDAKNRSEVEERIAVLEKQLGPSLTAQLMVPADARPGGPEPAPAPLTQTSLTDSDDGGRKRARLLPIAAGVASGVVVLGIVIGVGVYFGTRPSPAAIFEPVTP